ncbi:hypothetical protein G6F16_013269 [Rhizopus arrhizus]|nr:hypothetical protein G6F16_013269 [Rhizopus arrhizus]
MDTSRNRNQARHVQANGHRSINTNQQQDLVELIQQTIRQELNKQQTYNHPNRNYNSRYGRSNGNMDNNTGSNRNGLAYSNDHRNQQRYNNGNQPQQPQQNDQRHFQQHKSIKHENSQHQLNVILSDIETNYDPSQIELCAAIRPERPPDVTTATPYNKIKPTSKPKGKHPTLARKVVTRSHLGEIQPVSNQQNTSQHDINMDTDLPIQDRETIKQKRTRTKSEPTLIQYDIVSDVMKQKADIEIGELIQVAPTLRRKLISECRPKRISTKQQQQEQRQPMIQALDIVDDELNTTAAHSTVNWLICSG